MYDYNFYSWLSDNGWSRDYFYMTGRQQIGCMHNDWDIDYYGLVSGKYTFCCENKKTYEKKYISFDKPFSDYPDEIEKSLFKQLDEKN